MKKEGKKEVVGEVAATPLPIENVQKDLIEFLAHAKLNTASDFLRLNFLITKAVLAGVISPNQANATAANLRNNLKLMDLQFRVARVYVSGKDEKERNMLPDVKLFGDKPQLAEK